MPGFSSYEMVTSGNTFDVLWYGVELSDIWNSKVEVSANDVNITGSMPSGVAAVGGNYGTGIRDSSLLFRNNRFSGSVGVLLDEDTFHGAIPCAMVGNNVEHVTDIGYWFRPGTYGCTVVGQAKGTVLDETGGAHTIVGVTPHTGGVGQDLSNLLRGGKWPWLW
jgi:hypothetical protein